MVNDNVIKGNQEVVVGDKEVHFGTGCLHMYTVVILPCEVITLPQCNENMQKQLQALRCKHSQSNCLVS